MPKNPSLKKKELEDFDFSDLLESSYEDEAINSIMSNLIKANDDHMKLAFALTQLIVEKSSGDMNEEVIFLIFKKASKCVAENLPLKGLWEKLS